MCGAPICTCTQTRMAADERARGAGVVEVDVREQQMADVRELEPLRREAGVERADRRRRAAVEQPRPVFRLDDVHADDALEALVQQVDRCQSHGVNHRKEETVIVTTMNDIPGYDVEEVFGEVFGLTVRSRNIGSQFGASLKSIMGGELKGMTTALVDSREQVMQRMTEEAEKKGANAVIAMRFDTSEMGPNWTEICAYGTAVRVKKR